MTDIYESRPYTYLIGWKSLDTWYYGVRYAKAANPRDAKNLAARYGKTPL